MILPNRSNHTHLDSIRIRQLVVEVVILLVEVVGSQPVEVVEMQGNPQTHRILVLHPHNMLGMKRLEEVEVTPPEEEVVDLPLAVVEVEKLQAVAVAVLNRKFQCTDN